MTTTATHSEHSPAMHATEPVLCLAFALREKPGKLGCTTGHGQPPRARSIPARPQGRVLHEVAQATRRCGLPATAPVVSGDEAGREGVWLHRFVQAHGLPNSVVDASSIEVKRRTRRAKSAGWDVRQVLTRLRRSHHGARGVWRVGHVPSIEAEDQRHLPRDLATVQQERASTIARIQGILSSQGVRLTSVNKVPEHLDALRVWDGSPMPSGLRQRVLRVYAHDTFWSEQRAAVEAQRRGRRQSAPDATSEKGRQVMQRKGLGINGAWLLVMEVCGWRAFQNRREVGG